MYVCMYSHRRAHPHNPAAIPRPEVNKIKPHGHDGYKYTVRTHFALTKEPSRRSYLALVPLLL